MAPNPKDNVVGDSAFSVLLRYAELSDHKLSANHAATAAGIAKSTAFARIAAAKKNGVQKLSAAQLTNALPVLIKYGDASGHKLSANHVANVCGIAKSTAFAKLAQAKSDSKPHVAAPEADSEQAPQTTVEAAKKSTGKQGAKSKKDAAVKVETGTVPATAKGKGGRKRKLSVVDDQEIEVDPGTIANIKKNSLAVVIDNHDRTAVGLDVQDQPVDEISVAENTRAAAKNEVDANDKTGEAKEPSKKKRGRPSKKAKDNDSSSQTDTNGNGETGTTDSAPPSSQNGLQAVNDEHAAIINAAAIDSERSLTLDGATDANKIKKGAKMTKDGTAAVDVGYPVEITPCGTAGEMLDEANHLGTTTAGMHSVSLDPKGVSENNIATGAEDGFEKGKPKDTHDSLLAEFIDIEKGEAAAAEIQT